MDGQNNYWIYLFVFNLRKEKIQNEKSEKSWYHSQHWHKNSLKRNGPGIMQMKMWKKNPGSQSRV